jgi:solute:Na+ symporter, SSS family
LRFLIRASFGQAFITARNSQPVWRVAWSMYASSIGAWAIFLPASYTSFGGWVSIITYAVATGLPLFLIAEWGALILKNQPDVSLGVREDQSPGGASRSLGHFLVRLLSDCAILGGRSQVMSLNDFAGKRYGSSVKLFVIVLSLINMCVALVSEYTAIGDLFQFYVGTNRTAIIVFVGTVTSIYTAAGGLLVSIWTDQVGPEKNHTVT